MAKIHPENSPSELPLSVDDSELLLTPDNTIYTQHIIGKVALGDVMRDASRFDNIRIKRDESPDNDEWVYIFRPDREENAQAAEAFEDLSRILLQNDFPLRVGEREVDEDALLAFQQHIDDLAAEGVKAFDDELRSFLTGLEPEQDDGDDNSSRDDK